jgi:hypothetical protein
MKGTLRGGTSLDSSLGIDGEVDAPPSPPRNSNLLYATATRIIKGSMSERATHAHPHTRTRTKQDDACVCSTFCGLIRVGMDASIAIA